MIRDRLLAQPAALDNWAFNYAPFYYLALISCAEIVTAAISPQVGVLLHVAILLVLPFHYAVAHTRGARNAGLILTLALAPLIRIMSMALPLAKLPLVTWYVIIAVPLFAAAIVVARVLGQTGESTGLALKSRDVPVQVIIAASGFLLGVCEYLILRPQSLVPEDQTGLVVFAALVLVVGTGMLEEIIFRGVMQQAALIAMGARGLIYVSLVFAALHIGYLSLLDLLFVFLVGLFFAWVVRRTGSLMGVIVAHSLTNIMLYLIMPAVAAAFLPGLIS